VSSIVFVTAGNVCVGKLLFSPINIFKKTLRVLLVLMSSRKELGLNLCHSALSGLFAAEAGLIGLSCFKTTKIIRIITMRI